MFTSTPKKTDLPDQTRPKSKPVQRRDFPPLQPQSEIGRRYPVRPMVGARENLLNSLKKLWPFRSGQ